ncbi:hypothetical protein GCM10007905_34880 [Mixta theicola]|nr:hypothetical protein GCM10007905_34880 [Mixta theicola]
MGLTLILLTLLLLPARGSAGTVMFYGGLNVAGCNVAVVQEALNSECYRHGQWVRQSQPLRRITRDYLAEQSVQTQLIWLDKRQQRGMIIVSYQ